MVTVFSPNQLANIIQTTIPAQLPAGHTHAVVGAIDNTGAQVVAKFSLDNDKWAVDAAAKHSWTGDNSVGAQVILSW